MKGSHVRQLHELSQKSNARHRNGWQRTLRTASKHLTATEIALSLRIY